MSDLSFTQGADPVTVVNDISGNQLAINADGSINTLSIVQATSSDTREGYIVTTATTKTEIYATAQPTQTVGAQRSMNSTSANDTAVGTGAQTVRITYYVQTGTGLVTGPFIEIISLNGTAAVNTVATNIRYIEKLEVLTAGSSGENVGTIRLWTGTAASGTVFSSINATDGETFLAHHFVPSGKTCYITDILTGTNVATGTTGRFQIFSTDLSTANAAVKSIISFLYQPGGVLNNSLVFSSPRIIVGPAYIECYVTPGSATSQINSMTFNYYEL